ncbi:MAG: protein translocase subunit SecF [Chitinivibrionales bacterium]|nr:protein translocase subunit SecF [Chitinivibrionales bacterium]
MEWFTSPNFNFIGNKNKAFIISGLFIAVAILSLFVPIYPNRGIGLNWSIDFVGGTVVQLKFDQPVVDDLGTIRETVADLGYGKPEVKTIGRRADNEIQIIVKTKKEDAKVADNIKTALAEEYGAESFEVRRQEKVGPKVGGELGQKAVLSLLLALTAIVIYIGFRFHLPFGIAAIVALFHDVLVTVGIFSLANVEFSLPIVAALLTIVGYSLNDTIVVFDRIRENLGGSTVKRSFEDRVNSSINQCLSRTIITSLTTLLVVLTVFGFFLKSGDVITDFALALLVGVLVGTYSSMFIASPVLVLWNKKWPIK